MNFVQTIIRWILLVFIATYVVCSYIFLVLTIVPALVYHRLVQILARLFRPDLTQMLQAGLSWMALEKLTRPQLTVLFGLVLEGQVPLEELQSTFHSRVLTKEKKGPPNSKNLLERNPNLKYPELRQTWTQFLGFHFWKCEKNFDLCQHIRLYDYGENFDPGLRLPEVCTEEDLKKICGSLLSVPWRKDLSAWEILVVSNYKANDSTARTKTLLLVRFHHGMGDAHGWFQLLFMDWFDFRTLKMPAPSRSLIRSPWSSFLLPLRFPWDCARGLVNSFDSANPWHTNATRTREYRMSFTQPFPVVLIKEVMTRFDVSYSAVLVAAASAGIRRVMEEGGQSVPETMTAAMVVPIPRHPGDITFHASYSPLQWPISLKDPHERLLSLSEQLERNQNSTFALGWHHVLRIFNFYPNFMKQVGRDRYLSTLMASFFPGPLNRPTFQGSPLTDIFFTMGQSGQLGVMVTTVALAGFQRMAINIDKSLFPSDETFDKLGDFIHKELLELQQAARQYKRVSEIEEIV